MAINSFPINTRTVSLDQILAAEGYADAAEAARDSSFANAKGAATIADARALVADNETFIVYAAGATEFTAYRRLSSSTQVELGRYPAASRVQRVSSLALEQFADVAALAAAKGGVYLRINPAFCFQESAVTASTPANVGGLVGCIRGAEGSFFAVAFDDARRGTLQQDAAGNYYIAATGAAYIIRNAAGAAWDPTVEWTCIGGWRGGGSAFTWARNISNVARVQLSESLNDGNRTTFYRPDNSQGALMLTSTGDPVSLPHVLRVVKTLSDMRAHYNGNPQRGAAGPVVPFDDTAEVREVGLFMNRTGAVNANYSGRMYSFLMTPGVLTEQEAAICTAEAMRNTVPSRTRHVVDRNPVVLDFEAGSFQWGGATRALSDLTDNGDGTYDLSFVNWWNQERTIVVDLETERAGTSSGRFIEFLSENVSNEVIEVDDQSPTNLRVVYRSNVRNTIGFKDVWQEGTIGVKRFRAVLIVRPDGRIVERYFNGFAVTGSIVRGFSSIPPTAIRLRPQATGWKMTRAEFYGRALQGSELAGVLAGGPVANIHVVGDSFAGWNNSGFAREIETLLAADGAPLLISVDGVGGVAFFELSGNGHAQRFAQTPLQWAKTLIMIDGGFEYNRGEVVVRSSLLSMIEKLTHGTTKRYIFMEPNPINPVGDSRNTDWQAATGYIKTMIGNRYVDTLEAMFCLEDGSANDRADVAVGLWPRSTRSDSTHYLPAGQVVYAKAALGALRDLGFVAGTTALPGVVQNLIATGSVITWDAPASDGGHPIVGYIVQRNTGSWVTQDPQGSATGYTKQYLRTWTAPAAGTYRVAAITRKGTGDYTEVVVS
jgi:hypothetical protein